MKRLLRRLRAWWWGFHWWWPIIGWFEALRFCRICAGKGIVDDPSKTTGLNRWMLCHRCQGTGRRFGRRRA